MLFNLSFSSKWLKKPKRSKIKFYKFSCAIEYRNIMVKRVYFLPNLNF